MNYKSKRAIALNSPIEFKEVNPSDFSDAYKIEGEKIIVSPDKYGYLGNQIRENVDLEQSNTVVINAGVGQGKSSECINIAIEYINQKDDQGKNKYVVLFVAPFITLVNQYEKRLLAKNIAQSNICNYVNVSNGSVDINEVSQLPIHILTINTLIGSPGDDGFIQAKLKRDYLKLIIEHCEKERKKVVFIFDEMHESIHLFKEKFIFNLWKWRYILHKSFILSATYTEASKVVIKYLAELTKDKIQIVESERLKHPEQSRLHLVINNQFNYTAEDEELAKLIEEECQKGKSVHILCFSEKLASSIALPVRQANDTSKYSKIGSVLNRYFSEINLCTGKQQGLFDEKKCNVGTTFKTGVSIENENVSFFIITPHRAAYEEKYNKYFGIFSDGINSIIQAIARVRKGNNDIFIVMPVPKKLIERSSRSIDVGDYMINVRSVPDFKRLVKKNDYAKYYSLDSQYQLVFSFYGGVICDFMLPGIENYNERYWHEEERSESKPRLLPTTKDLFILEDGDRFLASGYEIFGSDISAYIVWAAYNNQFENATLKSVYYEEPFFLEEGKIIGGLFNIYYNVYGMPYNEEFISEKALYDSFYEFITSTIKVIVVKKNKKLEPAIKSSLVKIGVITVIQDIKRVNENFRKRIYPKGEMNIKGNVNVAEEFFIDNKMYLQAAIANSIRDLASNEDLKGVEKKRVEGYKSLYRHASDLKKIIVFKESGTRSFIPKKNFFIKNNIISNEIIDGLLSAIKDIRSTDTFISDDTFSFCQWADKVTIEQIHQNQQQRKKVLKSLIDEIRSLFFSTSITSISKQKVVTNGLGQSYKLGTQPYKISSEINFKTINAVNLIYTSSTPWLESDISESLKVALDLN